MSHFRVAKRLFVSNLPWTCGHGDLKNYFQRFGAVVSHNVVFDKKTGLSRKYGFIRFGNEDGFREVLKQKTHSIDGQIINIEEQSSTTALFDDNIEDLNYIKEEKKTMNNSQKLDPTENVLQ